MTDLERRLSFSSLTFLLSLPALQAAGCVITTSDDADDEGAEGSTTSPGTTSSTDSSTSTVGATEESTSATGGSGSDSGSDVTTFASSDGSDTGEDEGETEEEIPKECLDLEPSDLCTEFALHFAECYGVSKEELEEFVGYIAVYCTCDVEVLSPAYSKECAAASQDLYACLGAAPCEELEAETACEAEFEAASELCGGKP